MPSAVYASVFLAAIVIAATLAIYRDVSSRSLYAMGAVWGLIALYFALFGAYRLALGQLCFAGLPLLYALFRIYRVPQKIESVANEVEDAEGETDDIAEVSEERD